MTWSAFDKNKPLNPLYFSNGKNQEDVVKEVLELINAGKKIIFIHGVCGTGKSLIALNLANELGKTSIVVPGKNLQNQYKKDYEGNKYIKNSKGEKLKISVITGRKNHVCKFLEDNKNAIPPKSKDSQLNDIFQKKRDSFEELRANDMTADNPYIPCKIEIKEKNWHRLKEYLKQNKKVDVNEINEIKDVKRVPIASVCPYWSPVFPDKFELKSLSEKKRNYEGLGETTYTHYKRKKGCPFYEQFNSYIDSDAIVFNSLKYKLETALSRKPKTEVEIIDECDEFLDSLSNQRTINIDRLQNSLIQEISYEDDEGIVEELFELIAHFKKDPRLSKISENKDIIPLKATGIYDILKLFLKEKWLESVDDESYLHDVLETAKMFRGFIEESYVTIVKNEKSLQVGIVTTNLAKKLEEFVKKNKTIVLMSGTLHSKDVLQNIFGLNDFEYVEAEIQDQGTIHIRKTGLEMDCKYSNFSAGKFTREDYLKALDKCLEIAKRPTLVHINAFQDMPTEEEIKKYLLNNLISRDKLKEMQTVDTGSKLIKEFKEGKMDILFSTRDSRGVDFPGPECRSIVFTKYPNPNVQDAFWKILMKTKPHHYWSFYKDKARREFLQKIYRGLRHKEDYIELLSPDTRVLEMIEDGKIKKN
jgi:Rad3-related DNA helicase